MAQLEQKLDSLVKLFTPAQAEVARAQDRVDRHPSFSSASVGSASIPHPARDLSETNTNSFRQPSSGSQQTVTVQVQTPGPRTSVPYDAFLANPLPYDFEIENREAVFLLLEFRMQMATQCPFVVIHPDTTSESLRRKKPMLWKTIMTAALYHHPARQEALGWKLMEEFSTRLLLKAERSLDLLQALLVHLMWYHFHSVSNPQFLNLLALARTLVANLGLCQLPSSKGRPKIWLDGPGGLARHYDATDSSLDSTTLEEWRALAGCFFLSAV